MAHVLTNHYKIILTGTVTTPLTLPTDPYKDSINAIQQAIQPGTDHANQHAKIIIIEALCYIHCYCLSKK
jgi:hypothetical protein